MTVKEFADKYPVGSKIKYYPIAGKSGFVDVTIRSEPWELGHGEVVVKITGYAGGVSVSHIQGVGK